MCLVVNALGHVKACIGLSRRGETATDLYVLRRLQCTIELDIGYQRVVKTIKRSWNLDETTRKGVYRC
jgi:hypothetical protein